MKRTPAPFLIVTLLLITAHRLPAPISEIPTPTPAQSVKPKSKPVYNFNKKSSVAKQAATIADQQVQVVLSENTRVSLMHLRTYVETGEKIPKILFRLSELLRMAAGRRFRPLLPTDQPLYLIQHGEHISRKHFRPHSVSFRRSLETIDNESDWPLTLLCHTLDFS